jgi:uncharacterized protein (TIGR02452 family)
LGLPLHGKLDEVTLQSSSYCEGTKKKIRNMLRIMAEKGHTQIVLGAGGCGAFQNPPILMSKMFQEVFSEAEFAGRFERVDFAILRIFQNDQANVDAFSKICNDLIL